MKNKRNSLLERLYLGDFFPVERVTPGDPDYAAVSQKVGDEIEYIASRLSNEDNARFQELISLIMGEQESMIGYANFTYGLRTGILLMFELFFKKDDPPFRERD